MDHSHRTSRTSEAAWIAELGWLRRVCRALVREEALAEDLSQDVWVDAVRQRPDLEGPRLRGWLSKVARRRASKLLRRQRGARDSEALWLGDRSALESEDLPEDRLVLHRQLMDVIDHMDEVDRESIVAYFFEGLDTAEIARRSGVSEGALHQRRRRALGRLRQRLNNEDPRWTQWLPAIAFAGGRWSAPTAVLASSFPITALAIMWKSAITLTIVLLIAGAWWIGPHRTAKASPVLGIVQAEPVTLGAAPPLPINSTEVQVLSGDSQDRTSALDTERTAPATIDYLRVVDESGDPVPKAAGVWIDSERDLARLDFDSSGRAPRPTPRGGVVMIAAPGFLEAEFRIAVPDGAPETLVTLHRARTLSVRLLLDGAPLTRPSLFHHLPNTESQSIIRQLGIDPEERFWTPVESSRRNRGHLSSAGGILRITETATAGPMRITLPDWLLGKSVTAPMELDETATVLLVPKACFEPLAEADWELALMDEARIAEARFVWQDDQMPLRGQFTIRRSPPHFSNSIYRGNIGPDGSFRFSAANRGVHHDPPTSLAALGHFHLSLEDAPTGTFVAITIALASVPEDGNLGTIEVPRPREVRIQVIESDAAGASNPVRAAVSTKRSGACTGPDGMASVFVDSREAIWVQGESHGMVHIPHGRVAQVPQGELLVVEVQRRPCLTIGFVPETSTRGTELLLECDRPLFLEAEGLDGEATGPVRMTSNLWSIQRTLGTELGRVGGRLERAWILPAGTSPIRLAGLTGGAPITVSWLDELSQPIASTVVNLNEDRHVRFGVERPARLTVRAVLRGTNTPVAATVEIEEREATGGLMRPLIAGYTTFSALLPGAYQITVRASVGGAEVSSTTLFELGESEGEALFEF